MIRKIGKLEIRVIQAKLFRDTELFGKMDPFVEIRVGSVTLKTKTH